MPQSQPGPLNAMYGKHPNLGEKNGQWRGDKVGRGTLHRWVRRRLPLVDLCQNCHNNPPIDLANITGLYTRDLSNWKYLCRSCHMLSDGRMENLTGVPPGFKQSEETKKKLRLIKRARGTNGQYIKQ
jgi:hypothetical protein